MYGHDAHAAPLVEAQRIQIVVARDQSHAPATVVSRVRHHTGEQPRADPLPARWSIAHHQLAGVVLHTKDGEPHDGAGALCDKGRER